MKTPSLSHGIDFFISYAHSDERWGVWVASQLRAAGYSVKLMSWSFRPGCNFALEMHAAIGEARHVVALLSPDYLASEYCAAEWAAGFSTDPTGRDRRVIPVRVQSCTPTGLLGPIVFIDLVGLDETAAHGVLLGGVTQRAAGLSDAPAFPGGVPSAERATRTRPLFPSTLPIVWTVPFLPNPNFVGRQELLDGLHQRFTQASASGVACPQAVHGLGGVGKTQLAVEYCCQHRDTYDAVLWCGADSTQALQVNLAALAESSALNLPEARSADSQAQLIAVLRWLSQHQRWLLVFDNVDSRETLQEINAYLPKMLNGHILLTSRLSNWSDPYVDLAIGTLSDRDAVEFLVARATRRWAGVGTRDDAIAVTGALGNLPLALEQAAAYIHQRRITFRDYLATLNTPGSDVFQDVVPGGTGYPRSLIKTWTVSEQHFTPTARTILRVASTLSPDEVPRSLFMDGDPALVEAVTALSNEPGQSPAPCDRGTVEDGLTQLDDCSLITLNASAFACHRLVQAIQLDRIAAENREKWRLLILRIVTSYAPGHCADLRMKILGASIPVWSARVLKRRSSK